MAPLPGTAQTVTGLGKWFDSQIANRITLNGYRRLSYHNRSVLGDRDSYNLTEYYGQGLKTFTDFGQVQVTGTKVMGVINFDLNIQDSRFSDPQANRISLNYAKGNWGADLGDIRGSLATENRFANFEKSITGAQLTYKSKKFRVTAVASEVRGQPRTISIQGNNTSGPYYLQSSQIVRGSEQVLVDGVAQKFGEDYIMDYDLGSITFVNRNTGESKIIPPTSSIVATYEVFGFNGTKGRLEGAHVSYDFGRLGKVGLTGLRQVQGTTSRDSSYTEQYLGFLAPGTPITLRNEPLSRAAVQVFIGSELQVQGIGYDFQTGSNVIIILRRPVPQDVVLSVIYTPKPINTVQGDRQVLGLNYSLPLGSKGSIRYSQAIGKLSNSSSPSSGTARGLDLFYNATGMDLTASIRDVPQGFVGIESVGFSRNEKAQDLSVRWNKLSRQNYEFNVRNSEITDQTSTTPVKSKFTMVSAGTQYTPRGQGSPWNFSQSRIMSKTGTQNSRIDSTNFGTSGSRGKMDWRLGLSQQFAEGPTTIDSVQQQRHLTLHALDYRLKYNASKAWVLDWTSSLSRVQTDGKSSMGRDLLFGFRYRPNQKLMIRGQAADSDAGQLASLGFVGGLGIGYDGNGFSSGADTSTFTEASNARTAFLSATFTPNDAWALNADINFYKSQGGVSSNTESTSLDLGINWQARRDLSFDTIFNVSRTRFLGTTLQTDSSTLSLYATSQPKGNLSWNGGFTMLTSSGSSQFNQNSLTYELRANYRLAPRHSMSFEMDNGRLSGYLPQETRNLSLTYQYQIWKSLAFNIGYRIIDVINRDSTLSSGGYGSRGFDIELQFNFGR